MRRPLDPLLRLLLGVALSLPLCLALWWWLVREPLIIGLAHTVNIVSPWLWPETVLIVGLRGDLGLIVTLLPPLTGSAEMFMALPLSFNRAVVTLPLFWGLTLATPARALLRRLLLGTIFLLPVIFAMVLLYAQFQIAAGQGGHDDTVLQRQRPQPDGGKQFRFHGLRPYADWLERISTSRDHERQDTRG